MTLRKNWWHASGGMLKLRPMGKVSRLSLKRIFTFPPSFVPTWRWKKNGRPSLILRQQVAIHENVEFWGAGGAFPISGHQIKGTPHQILNCEQALKGLQNDLFPEGATNSLPNDK